MNKNVEKAVSCISLTDNYLNFHLKKTLGWDS